MNPIIEKIQKLMTTATDSAATSAESNTAMRLAQRLMLAHRISEQDIKDHARAKAIASGDVQAEDMATLPLGPYKDRTDGWLAMATGHICGIGVYSAWDYQTSRPSKQMVGYGLPSDLAISKEIYLWLREKLQLDRRAAQYTKSSLSGRSFADGFALAILEKAKTESAARKRSSETIEIPATPQSTALVIVEGEYEQRLGDALVKKARIIGVGKSRKVRLRNRDWNAHGRGEQAGSKCSLSKSVIR